MIHSRLGVANKKGGNVQWKNQTIIQLLQKRSSLIHRAILTVFFQVLQIILSAL
jgi:hypothetical protein